MRVQLQSMMIACAWTHGLDTWVYFAGAIAIFLPLYEAKEIAKAVFGFGKLADTRKRKAVARNTEVPSKPSPDNSLRAHDVELGEHKPANGSTATLKI